MGLWGRWAAERAGREQAAAFVRALLVDPPESDVRCWPRSARTATPITRDGSFATRGGRPGCWPRSATPSMTGRRRSSRPPWRGRCAAILTWPPTAQEHCCPPIQHSPLGLRRRAGRQERARRGRATGSGRVLLGFAGRLDPSIADLEAAGAIVDGISRSRHRTALRRPSGPPILAGRRRSIGDRSGGRSRERGCGSRAGCSYSRPARVLFRRLLRIPAETIQRTLSAEGGTRTPTGYRPLRPERSASTSSTTSANGVV